MRFSLKQPLFFIAFAHLTLELCSQYLPIVYPLLITALNLSYTQVGVVALVVGLSGSLAQPLFGYLGDRWDPVLLAMLSVAWLAIFMGLVGATWSYLALILVVGLGMLGSAGFHPPGAMIASAVGGSRRGAAMSIFSVGGNLGTAMSPLLIAASVGWLGVKGTLVLIPIALPISLILYYFLRQAAPPASLRAATAQKRPQTLIRQGSLAGLILVVLLSMARSWFQMSLSTYLPVWVESQGQTLAFASQILFAFSISISLGSLVGGVLSDWIGQWQVLVLGSVFLVIGYWLFLGASDLGQVALVGLMGVMIGSSYPVAILLAQEVWPQGVGLASALVMGIGWAPGGLGASVTGLIADRLSLAAGLQALILAPILWLGCMLIFGLVQRRMAKNRPLDAEAV